MKVSLDTMKSWFKKGLYPTESQFASVFDSFWHKDEIIPLGNVKNLTQILNGKAPESHNHELNDITDLTAFEQEINNQLATKADVEHEHQQYLTEHQDISGKANKATNPTIGNFATLDADGNPVDSGKSTSDFAEANHNHDEVYSPIEHKHAQYLTEHQDISGKQNKTDKALQTTDKSVVGAINELHQEVADLKENGTNASVDIALVVSTTYAELKQLRDSSALSPGTWYRITDYETTVYNNANARSAGHFFDILVQATDVNILSEDAKAVHSARDTDGYFAHANLGAWKLKYSLDNDPAKFAWASDGGEKWTTTLPEIGLLELTPVSTNDTTYEGCPYKFSASFSGMALTVYVAHLELQEGEEFIHNVLVIEGMGEPMVDQFPVTGIVHENQTPGKGVIWEMEDEYNNLCSYDFKNIQFKRSLIVATKDDPSEDECAFFGKYVGQAMEELPALPEGYAIDPNDSKYLYTFSVIAADGSVEDNSLGVDLTSAGMGIYHLCGENRMRPNMNVSSFAMDLNNNVFVATCNSIEDMMNIIQMGNTFDAMCQGNTFVNMTTCNTFGNGCYDNSFGNYCVWNSFGNECYNNSFGNGCYDNSFGNDCDSNSFGNECYNNSFGNECYNNSFGNSCSSNSFGNDCDSNSFGNYCYYNSFGNSCGGNSFGNGCQYNDILDNVRYITVFEGVYNVSIGSTSGTVQYAQVLNGTCGSSSSNKLQINFATGKSYTQIAGKNSSGELKIWVPADVVA